MSDRMRTIDDEKKRVLRFIELAHNLPTANILDEPTRCLQYNLEWSVIIEGWLSHLASVGLWKDALEDDYSGILQIQSMLAGIDCGAGTGGVCMTKALATSTWQPASQVSYQGTPFVDIDANASIDLTLNGSGLTQVHFSGTFTAASRDTLFRVRTGLIYSEITNIQFSSSGAENVTIIAEFLDLPAGLTSFFLQWSTDIYLTDIDTSDLLTMAVWEIGDGGGGGAVFDCDDVEVCLDTSPTIADIELDVSENSTAIQEQQSTAHNTNVYPPAPTQASSPGELCGSAWHIANSLDTLCQEALTDAATITLEEFLTALLGFGGWQSDLLILLWDFAVANINPNLDTELTSAIPFVAEHFYCNDLDPIAAQSAINADANISTDARAYLSTAIDSLTDAKLQLWTFIGSQDLSQDCSTFCVCTNVVLLGTYQMNSPPPTDITYVGGTPIPGSSGDCLAIFDGDEIIFDNGLVHDFTSITIYTGELSGTATLDYQIFIDNILITNGNFQNGGNCNFSKTNSVQLDTTGQEIRITRNGGTSAYVVERFNLYECL